jgi:hypothetical protein
VQLDEEDAGKLIEDEVLRQAPPRPAPVRPCPRQRAHCRLAVCEVPVLNGLCFCKLPDDSDEENRLDSDEKVSGLDSDGKVSAPLFVTERRQQLALWI